MDKELFELCKEVYKRKPNWIKTDKSWSWFGQHPSKSLPSTGYEIINGRNDEFVCPLYTSDYLLGRLPMFLLRDGKDYWSRLSPFTEKSWSAWYLHDESIAIHRSADTPVKALLKLVIALDEAGELT